MYRISKVEKGDSGMDLGVSSWHSANPRGTPKADDIHPEYASNIALNRLRKLVDKHNEKCPVNPFDVSQKNVLDAYRMRMRQASKNLEQKAEEKKISIERKLEESERKLDQVLKFGKELIANSKLNNSKRELERWEEEFERNAVLQGVMNKEYVESMAHFNELSSQWSELQEYTEPMEVFEELEKQKANVDEILKSKDAIIAKCQAEIERNTVRYYDELRRQNNEVCCMMERVEKQSEIVNKAYSDYLDILQHTIDEERQNISLAASNKFHNFSTGVFEIENLKIDIVHNKVALYAKEIHRITETQEELTRATRMRLEKESEEVERDLRDMKFEILRNSEMTDYSYQVMLKRNEENMNISNQQKRRVAHLTEMVHAMKERLTKSIRGHAATQLELRENIKKVHGSLSVVEATRQHCKQQNLKKFNAVWACNFAEIKTLLLKAYEIDRLLYEQQLMMPYKMPNIDFTDIHADANKSFNSRRPSKRPHKSTKKQNDDIDIGLLRNIVRMLSDRGRFLVESKLLKLLHYYNTKDEAAVMRLDNIFTALNITNMQTVRVLTKRFMPYTYCPNCSKGISEEALWRYMKLPRESKKNEAESDGPTTEKPPSPPPKQKPTKQAPCPNHHLVIEPACVLTALSDYTKEQAAKRKFVFHQVIEERKHNLIPFNKKQIKEFFGKFRNYMPEEKRRMWKIMEHGLNHYLDVLRQRAQLDKECVILRQQNAELKYFFRQYNV